MNYPYRARISCLPSKQKGFTLLELLFTLVLMLIVVVAVQRYVAGVTIDEEHFSNQQDQTSQLFMVLGNIRNDVAKAGFTPVASEIKAQRIDNPVEIRPCSTTTKGACQNNTELVIRYWAFGNGSTVYDCIGDKVSNRTGKWALVENIYRVKDNGELGCSGNGGKTGKTDSMFNNVDSFNWQLGEADLNTGARMLSLCFTTRLDQKTAIVKKGQAINCVTNNPVDVASNPSNIFNTTRVDLVVRPSNVTLMTGTGGS